MNNTHPPYTRHGVQQPSGASWSSSSLYTNGNSNSNSHPNSGPVGTACSSPDGGGDYPTTVSEGQHQHFYSSLHNALASDAAHASNLNASAGSAGYSSLGLHTYSPLPGGSPVQRQPGAPFNALNNIYSPSSARSVREWADNLLVMDDTAEPFPDYIHSPDASNFFRRAPVSVKHEPEDADMGRMDAQQQRARSHFVMEHHPASAYGHHAPASASGPTSSSSHPHPQHSPHDGFASPLSPLSPVGAGTLSPGARAHPAPSAVGTGAAATASGASSDAFRPSADTKALHTLSPFSAFSSAGGVAGVSSPMPDMLFDVGANGGGDADPQASLLAGAPAEPILPHAMTAPLRAVNASKEMRRMMGVFRLNPFTMMNGAPVKSAWDGSCAGPLESEPVQLEFRVYFEGMLIEDDEEEDGGGAGGGGGGGGGGGRGRSNDDRYMDTGNGYDDYGPGASQAYLASRRAFGHVQRTATRVPSPPTFNPYGLRTSGSGAGPSNMGVSTSIARSIFDRDLERQREMRGVSVSASANVGPFASSSSSAMAHYPSYPSQNSQNGQNPHHHTAINANAMNSHNAALLRSHSTASGSVSDGLSDSSTAGVCAVPESTLGVSGADPADFLAGVDLDTSRPHSQGSLGATLTSAFAPTPSAYTGASTQAALRAQPHSHSQPLFRGAGASAAHGGASANMFTTTPAALAAEMHLTARARQMYGAGRTRHGSLSSNRSELSGSGSASPPVMHGAAEYQRQAVHRSPSLLHQQQQQQQRPARQAQQAYQQVGSAVALDLNALAAPTPAVGQQSFIGPGHGGEPYVRDQNNATAYGLSSASFGGPFDGSNHGHVSPIDHSAGLSRRWPDTSSVQRVYS